MNLARFFSNEERLRSTLLTVLDAVDYTNNACSPTEMVSAVLPKEVIELARFVIKDTQPKTKKPKK